MQNPQIYKSDYIKYLIIQNPLFYAKYLKYGFKIIIYNVYIYISWEKWFFKDICPALKVSYANTPTYAQNQIHSNTAVVMPHTSTYFC